MKRAGLLIFLIHSVLLSCLFAKSVPHDILGKWRNPTGEKVVEVYEQKGLYYGKLIECTDQELPLGTMILKDFKFNFSTNKWEGTIYIPIQGKDFPGTLTLKDNETLVLEADFGFMTMAREWKSEGK